MNSVYYTYTNIGYTIDEANVQSKFIYAYEQASKFQLSPMVPARHAGINLRPYPRVSGSEVLFLLRWLLRPVSGTGHRVPALPGGEQTDKRLSTPVRTAQPLCVEADPFVQGEILEDKSVGHRNNLERKSRGLAR